MKVADTDPRDFFIGMVVGIPVGLAMWALLIRGILAMI